MFPPPHEKQFYVSSVSSWIWIEGRKCDECVCWTLIASSFLVLLDPEGVYIRSAGKCTSGANSCSVHAPAAGASSAASLSQFTLAVRDVSDVG